MLKDKTVILGVSGSIAAYKAADVASRLVREGITIKVVMTEAATQFISALTFKTITRQPVGVDEFESEPPGKIYHLSLAEEADLILVAPATANVMAKIARGIADDLLTTTILSAKCPLLIAPAMNPKMYLAEETQENLKLLRRTGCRIIEPAVGKLACGVEGVGRLAPVEDIVNAVKEGLAEQEDLKGFKVLVTAGGTQELIDPVRFISNRSSGKMGHALAEEAARRGAEVTLVSGPSELVAWEKIDLVPVQTAEEMRNAVLKHFDKAQVLIMAAAVADYRPAQPGKSKIKSGSSKLELTLIPNPDILGELGQRKKKGQLLIGFAAETEDLLENAERKLKAKNLDLIVANDISRPEIGIGSDENEVYLLSPGGKPEHLPRTSKREIARIILNKVVELSRSSK